MPGEDEEVRLDASMRDAELVASLARIEQRLHSVEDQLEDLGTAGKAAGKALDSGMEQAADGADKAKRAATQATPPVKELGDEAAKTGVKARSGASGLDRFASKARRAARQSKGLGGILMAYKLAAVVVGITALAGGVSALAAGAGIAIGYLAPMLGILLGLGPLGLAAAVGLWAYKAAAESLTGPLAALKADFDGIGEAVARGGLASGLMDMAGDLDGLGTSITRNMGGVGGVLGEGARQAGKWAGSARTVEQVNRIFAGLLPILAALLRLIAPVGQVLLNVLEGSLPLAQLMANALENLAEHAAEWTSMQLASGRMTAWLLKGWERATMIGGALLDFLVGLFNILKIGAGYAGDMGDSLQTAAADFRAWTTSAEGQARINQYFSDSLPTLREAGQLVLAIARGFGALGANPNIAPLLAQIRTELVPALGQLMTNLTGEGGLGPALIHAAASVLTFLASLDFSALTTFAQAFGAVITGVVWLMQNVPGASLVVSSLVFSLMGIKAVGMVWGVVAKGAAAFSWMQKAMTLTTGLSLGQKAFAGVVRGVGSAFKWVGGIIVTVIRAIGIAFMANPIIAAIAIIIGILVLLYMKCEWFREGVHAILRFIADAAVAAWDWIKRAFVVVVDAVVAAAKWLWENGLRPIWEVISTGVRIYVEAWYTVVKTVIDWIVTAATWLWQNGIKPAWDAIAKGAEIAWGVIKWIVEAVVFFIALHVALIAKAAEAVWWAITTAAKWAWETVILPLVRWVVDLVVGYFRLLQQGWDILTSALAAAWNWVMMTIVTPVINWVRQQWVSLVTGMQMAWAYLFGNYIGPAIEWFKALWNTAVEGIRNAWDIVVTWVSDKWAIISEAASRTVDLVKGYWESGLNWLKDFFAPVTDGISKLWDGISSAAGKAADVVKGAWDKVVGAVKGAWNAIASGWNSIPSITVPDWVPGMGGNTFSLPKLPTLWHGGPTPGGPALVGEHGPEPLVRGGRVVDMLGANGPEVRNLPRGGYVVPNLSTLASLPGLARSIPGSVAAAIASSATSAPAPVSGSGDGELLAAIAELTHAVRTNRPIHVSGGAGTEEAVLAALRTHEREQVARGRYSYVAGKG